VFPFSRPPSYQEKTELAKLIANRGLQTPTQRPAPLVRPAGMPWLKENMDMTTLGLGVLGAGAGFAAAPLVGVAGLPLAAGLAGLGVFAPQVADYFLNPAAPAPPLLPTQTQANPASAQQYGLGVNRPYSFGPQGIFGEAYTPTDWSDTNPILQALGFPEKQPELTDQYTGWNPASQLAEFSRRMAWKQQLATERSAYDNPMYEALAPNRVFAKAVKDYAGDTLAGLGTLPERLGGVWSRTAAMETKNPLSKAYGFLMGQNENWTPNAESGHGLLMETLRTLEPEVQAIQGLYTATKGLLGLNKQPTSDEKALDFILANKQEDAGSRALKIANYHTSGIWPENVPKPSNADYLGAHVTYNINHAQENFTKLPLGEQMLSLVVAPELASTLMPAVGIGRIAKLTGKYAEATFKPSMSLLQDWNTIKTGVTKTALRFVQAELGGTYKATGLQKPSTIIAAINSGEIFNPKNITHSVRNWLVKKGMGIFDMTVESKAQAIAEQGMEHFYELLKRTDNNNVGQFVQSMVDLGDWSPVDLPELMTSQQKSALKILEDMSMGNQTLTGDIAKFYGFEDNQVINNLTSTNGVMSRKLLLNMSEGSIVRAKDGSIIEKTAEQIQSGVDKIIDLINKSRLPLEAGDRSPLLMTAAYDAQAALVKRTVNSALGLLGVEDVPTFIRSKENTWVQWQRWYAKMWHIGPVPGVGIRNVMGDMTKLALQDKEAFRADANYMKIWNEGLPTYLGLRGVEKSGKKTFAVREGFLATDSATPLWKKLGFESGSYFQQFTEEWLHNKVQAGAIQSFMDRFHRTKAMSLDYGDMSSVPPDLLLLINNKLNKAITPAEIQRAFGDIYQGIHWTADNTLMNIINNLRANPNINREVGEAAIQMLDDFKSDTTPERFLNGLQDLVADQLTVKYYEIESNLIMLNDWQIKVPERQGLYVVDGISFGMSDQENAIHHAFLEPDSDSGKAVIEELRKRGVDQVDFLRKGQDIQDAITKKIADIKPREKERVANVTKYITEYYPDLYAGVTSTDKKTLERLEGYYQNSIARELNLRNTVDAMAESMIGEYAKGKKSFNLETAVIRFGTTDTTVADFIRKTFTQVSKDGKITYLAEGKWLQQFETNQKIVLTDVSRELVAGEMLENIRNMAGVLRQKVGGLASFERNAAIKAGTLSNVERGRIDMRIAGTMKDYWVGVAQLYKQLSGSNLEVEVLRTRGVPLITASDIANTAAVKASKENSYKEAILLLRKASDSQDWSSIGPVTYRKLVVYSDSNKPAMAAFSEMSVILQGLGVSPKSARDLLNNTLAANVIMTAKNKRTWDVRQVIETAKANNLLGFYDDAMNFVSQTGVLAKEKRAAKAIATARYIPSVPAGTFGVDSIPVDWFSSDMRGVSFVTFSDGSIGKIQYWIDEDTFVYAMKDTMDVIRKGEYSTPELWLLENANKGPDGNYRPAYRADFENWVANQKRIFEPLADVDQVFEGKPRFAQTFQGGQLVIDEVEYKRVFEELPVYPSYAEPTADRIEILPGTSIFNTDLGSLEDGPPQWFYATDNDWRLFLEGQEKDAVKARLENAKYVNATVKIKDTKQREYLATLSALKEETARTLNDWQSALFREYGKGVFLNQFQLDIMQGKSVGSVVQYDLTWHTTTAAQDYKAVAGRLESSRTVARAGIRIPALPTNNIELISASRAADAQAAAAEAAEGAKVLATPGMSTFGAPALQQATTEAITSKASGLPERGIVSPARNLDLPGLADQFNRELLETWNSIQSLSESYRVSKLPTATKFQPAKPARQTIPGLTANADKMPITSKMAGKDKVYVPEYGIYGTGPVTEEELRGILERGIEPNILDDQGGPSTFRLYASKEAARLKPSAAQTEVRFMVRNTGQFKAGRTFLSNTGTVLPKDIFVIDPAYYGAKAFKKSFKKILEEKGIQTVIPDEIIGDGITLVTARAPTRTGPARFGDEEVFVSGFAGNKNGVPHVTLLEYTDSVPESGITYEIQAGPTREEANIAEDVYIKSRYNALNSHQSGVAPSTYNEIRNFIYKYEEKDRLVFSKYKRLFELLRNQTELNALPELQMTMEVRNFIRSAAGNMSGLEMGSPAWQKHLMSGPLGEWIDSQPTLRAYLNRIEERKQQVVDLINQRGLKADVDKIGVEDMPHWFAEEAPTEDAYQAAQYAKTSSPIDNLQPSDLTFDDMMGNQPDWDEFDAAMAAPPAAAAIPPDASGVAAVPNQGNSSTVNAFTRKVLRPAQQAQIKSNQTISSLKELQERASMIWGDNSQVSTSKLSAEAIQQLQKLQAHKLERLTFARSVANRVASATTDHLLYNYNRTYNFDSHLNNIFGYPFWYTRTFTDYPRQLLSDPNYLSKLYQWNKQINKINEDDKLPRWMRSSVKMKVPDIFNLQDMMGTETMYLPMIAQLSPLEQLLNGQFTNAERERNIMGQAYNRLYGWGPGPHALIPLALGTALFAAGRAGNNEDYINQAAQYFGYLGSQTKLIPSITAQMEKASGSTFPISGGISPDSVLMAFGAAGAMASPKGSMPLRALMGLGAAVQFMVTHTMTKDGVKFVGPVYDQRRVASVLAEWGNTPNKMVAGLNITPELLQDAAIVSKDPYLYGSRPELSGAYSIWSAAVTEARSRKMVPDIISYFGGPGMSARGEGEVRQEEMYQTVQALFDKRDDKSITPEQYSEEWTKISLQFPDFPIYGMFKRYGDKAFNVYAYSVISRVGKGSTAKAVYNTVGLDYDIIGKFYDNKGNFTYGTEEAQLKEGLLRLGMLLKSPDVATKTEWSNAGILFRKLQGEMETMFPGTSSKLDVFYNLEKDEQAQFLRDHLDLKARMETELALTIQDPKYRNTLGPYYVSIKDTRDFIKLVYMSKDPARAKAYEIYLENSRDWPEQKEKQFLADFDLYNFHRGFQKMTSNLDNTVASLLNGIALPKLPTVRADAPDIEAKKSMINSLMQISQTAEAQARTNAAVAGGNGAAPAPGMPSGMGGNAPTIAPAGAGVGGGAMPGMMSGNGTGTIRQENPSANLLQQWEYLYSQKQVSGVGYVQEYKEQLKYQTLQPLLDYFKGDTVAFMKALDTPLLSSKWPTFSDPNKWEENLLQYVRLLGGESLRSAMTIEVSKGVPSDVNNMVWSKVIGTVRALSLAEIGRMSSQHPELRDLGIVREQSSTYSGPTFNGLLDTIGASVSIQEDGSISVSGETVKKTKGGDKGLQASDIEDYVSKWAKQYYGENIEQLYENYIMVNVAQGSKAARAYWNKYPQLAKYQAFSATIWKRYGDVKNDLKEGFDDVAEIIKILNKITPSVVKRGDKDSSGYEAFSAMLTSKSVIEQLPVQSLNQSKAIDGRLFANVLAVLKARNPSLAQAFAEFMQANPQRRQAMLQASPDLARYITQFTPEQLGDIEISYNRGLDIGGNSYGQGGGVRVYKERSGRTGL